MKNTKKTEREATLEEAEVRAARRALADLATTSEASVEQYGGRAVAAGLAGLLALYIRDLPAEEAERVQGLTTALVASFDQHAAQRGQA